MTNGVYKIKLAICLLVNWSICHAKNPNKVVFGMQKSIEEFPYLVSINFGNFENPICGGSIMSELFILTTASCVILELSPLTFLSNIKILSGTNDKYNTDGSGSVHEVAKIIYHELYDDQSLWINDIALLKLETPIKFSETSLPASPAEHHVRAHTRVKVIGWGGERYLSVLPMKFENNDECQSIYRNLRIFIHVYVQGCISLQKVRRGGRGVVEGDTGDPVVRDNKIVGIISLMIPGKINSAISTKIWPFKNWIEIVISKA